MQYIQINGIICHFSFSLCVNKMTAYIVRYKHSMSDICSYMYKEAVRMVKFVNIAYFGNSVFYHEPEVYIV